MKPLASFVGIIGFFTIFYCLVIGIVNVPLNIPSKREPAGPSEAEKETAADEASAKAACSEDLDAAILRKLSLQVYTSGNDSLRRVETVLARIRCLQEWAMSVPDRCARDSYLKWLESYQKDAEGYKKRIEYEASHEVPTPPASCERDLIGKVK